MYVQGQLFHYITEFKYNLHVKTKTTVCVCVYTVHTHTQTHFTEHSGILSFTILKKFIQY